MKKNEKRILTISVLLICLWLFTGITAFAAEGESLKTLSAAFIQQTGGINTLIYTSVGVVLAGVGFMVRKKI